MTDQQIEAYIKNSLKAQMDARRAFYEARMEYAKALGRGDATRKMRENVEQLRKEYDATA